MSTEKVSIRAPIEERLASRSVITETGCLEYRCKTTQRTGHRRIGYQKSYPLVHRVAWELANGPIPEGAEIHHTCDNFACINIDHLVIGSLRERLRKKLTSNTRALPNGCTVYAGASDVLFGYVRLGFQGKRAMAHRLMWELTNGPIPDGLIVRHSCDNPPCINIDHLSLGTHYENSLDCSVRGRRVTKLTSEQVYEIRCLSDRGESAVKLAKQFGVSHSTIKNIHARRVWKHLPEVGNG